MTTQLDPVVANPFALMMDPEAVFRAIERSGRLAHLKSRVCRPLDKPLLQGAAASEVEETAEVCSPSIDSIE